MEVITVPYSWPYFVVIFTYMGLNNRPKIYIWNRYLQSIGSWNGHQLGGGAFSGSQGWRSRSEPSPRGKMMCFHKI